MSEEIQQSPPPEEVVLAEQIQAPDVSQLRHAGDGAIDCVVDHPVHGPIPYTARSDDADPFGAAVWGAVNEPGLTIADAAPEPVIVPAEVTKLQLVRALRQQGIWANMSAALNAPTTPDETREDWEMAHIIPRQDDLMTGFASDLGFTPEEIDAVFILAGTF